MISAINAYRTAAGLPAMTWSDTLARNAARTGEATGGREMRHMMNKGSYGQVLVMGFDDVDTCKRDMEGYSPFELYYLSWLCEVPGDVGLGGKCAEILKISRINVIGQRGHHDILANTAYSKIGCAFTRNEASRKCGQFTGVWACDVGY